MQLWQGLRDANKRIRQQRSTALHNSFIKLATHSSTFRYIAVRQGTPALP